MEVGDTARRVAPYPNQHLIEQEASRLLALPRQQARARFSDKVARTFLIENDHARTIDLDFNARLATALRERAQARNVATIWGYW